MITEVEKVQRTVHKARKGVAGGLGCLCGRLETTSSVILGMFIFTVAGIKVYVN